jgi:hypothetical protein
MERLVRASGDGKQPPPAASPKLGLAGLAQNTMEDRKPVQLFLGFPITVISGFAYCTASMSMVGVPALPHTQRIRSNLLTQCMVQCRCS